MGTKSIIAAKCTDGKYRSIYCHWEGYPEWVGATLEAHYSSQELAEKLISGGDLSQLEENCDNPPRGHCYQTPSEGQCVYYMRDRGETGCDAITSDSVESAFIRDSGQDFEYLWDGDRWVGREEGGSFKTIQELINDDV